MADQKPMTEQLLTPTYSNDIEREQAETRRVLRLVAPYFPQLHAAALLDAPATNIPADAAHLAFDAWSAEQERYITNHMLPYWLQMPAAYIAALTTPSGNDAAPWQAQVVVLARQHRRAASGADVAVG